MLRAVKRIDRVASAGRDAFSRDEQAQIWVIHHLEILGEAARSLSEALRAAHPDVPWSTIIGLRNVLIHHYFDVDVGRVWGAIEVDLPPVRSSLERIAAELAEADPKPPSSAP